MLSQGMKQGLGKGVDVELDLRLRTGLLQGLQLKYINGLEQVLEKELRKEVELGQTQDQK